MLDILRTKYTSERRRNKKIQAHERSLSPYLFVACMERISQLIKREVLQGKWHPFPTSYNGPRISSLLFADDVVLFTKASAEQAQIIKSYLTRFCRALRQMVSGVKSSVFFLANTDTQLIESICTVHGMPWTDDLGWYLGVPTLHGKVDRNTY